MSDTPHSEPRSTVERVAGSMIRVGRALLEEVGADDRSHIVVLVRLSPRPAGELDATTAVLGFSADGDRAQHAALAALLEHARRMAQALGLGLEIIAAPRRLRGRG